MNSHYKDMMGGRSSYLYNGNPYTWKDGLYIEIPPVSDDAVTTSDQNQPGR